MEIGKLVFDDFAEKQLELVERHGGMITDISKQSKKRAETSLAFSKKSVKIDRLISNPLII
jgi:hypothetical protein